MQLLHIADLHFGRLLYGRSLMDDQRHFVRQSLLPALDEYKPDALLIAGDLYDLADCLGRCDSFIRRAHRCAVRTEHPRRHHFRQPRQPGTALRWAKACLRGTASISSRSLKTRLRRSRSANIQIFPLPYFENAQMRDFLGDETLRGAGPACARR